MADIAGNSYAVEQGFTVTKPGLLDGLTGNSGGSAACPATLAIMAFALSAAFYRR